MIEYANQATPESNRWGPMRVLAWLASAVAWAVAGLFVMGVIGGVVWLAGREMGAAVSPLASFTLILVVASAARDVRRRRALAALVYLEQAVRLNLPLTPMLASARLGERPGVARRLLHLEELLVAGTSVADAVEAALPELPGRVLRTVRTAERLGRLPDALARVSRSERPRGPHDPTAAFYRSYPVLLLAGVSVIIMWLMIFVMPRMQMIARDFGMPVPAVTLGLISFAAMLGPVLVVGSVLLMVVLAGRALWDVFVPRRARVAARWVTDPVEWATPLLGRSAMDRGVADVCWLLADAAEAGLPMDVALAEAERLDLNVMLHRRIERWRRAVERGASLAEGARGARLPHVLTGMLETTTADLPGVFRFLARYYGGRFSRAQALIRAAVVPGIAIAMGLVVAIVGVSLFLPLAQLVDRMAPRIGSYL